VDLEGLLPSMATTYMAASFTANETLCSSLVKATEVVYGSPPETAALSRRNRRMPAVFSSDKDETTLLAADEHVYGVPRQLLWPARRSADIFSSSAVKRCRCWSR
jgi:hypothetical protein